MLSVNIYGEAEYIKTQLTERSKRKEELVRFAKKAFGAMKEKQKLQNELWYKLQEISPQRREYSVAKERQLKARGEYVLAKSRYLDICDQIKQAKDEIKFLVQELERRKTLIFLEAYLQENSKVKIDDLIIKREPGGRYSVYIFPDGFSGRHGHIMVSREGEIRYLHSAMERSPRAPVTTGA